MLRSHSWTIRALRLLRSAPWDASTAVASSLLASAPIEEETAPHYNPSHFYPMRLGEVLLDRYQVATKLGWGTSSTVWLARDLHQWRCFGDRYVAIKVKTNKYVDKDSAEAELRITRHLSRANPKHEGFQFVRALLDSFDIQGPCGTHVCLVLEPLREPLWLLKRRFPDELISSDLLKMMVEMLLKGLDYLHTECQVIHTDLKPDNILVGLECQSMLEDHAREEFENPLPQKAIDDRTIYLSRNDFGRPKPGIGTPKITDFGLASWGHVPRPHNHAIQPEIFRAPEVILAAGWTYSVDIWNLGVMLWNLLEGRALFEALNPRDSNYTSEQHIAHISALLGPPPKQLLARGERTTRYFSSDGEFKHSGLIPRDFTLAGTLRHVKDEDKRLLLEFVKRMLQWLPEDRSTARELLSDPWLKARFPEETD